MVAGRGTPEQAPARAMLYRAPAIFDALIERITAATIAYLGAQVAAGAEVVKLFDSWAGVAARAAVRALCRRAGAQDPAAVRAAHPGVPVIGFPRGAGGGYAGFAREAGVPAVALDTAVDPAWASAELRRGSACRATSIRCCWSSAARRWRRRLGEMVEALAGREHIFNLGHGITPDAAPENVETLLRAIRQD